MVLLEHRASKETCQEAFVKERRLGRVSQEGDEDMNIGNSSNMSPLPPSRPGRAAPFLERLVKAVKCKDGPFGAISGLSFSAWRVHRRPQMSRGHPGLHICQLHTAALAQHPWRKGPSSVRNTCQSSVLGGMKVPAPPPPSKL